tara:strand:- start:41 stop:1927 length:1887 start_codon:yes stop_codon:yes gene_type:complete
MATNADHYRSYNTGVVEMYRGYIDESREAAELTNKSIAERRSELQKIIRDLDSDIMSAQRALETGQTTHFKAHMTARGDRVRAARASARASGRAGSELDKLREKARAATAASLQEAVEFAATQGDDQFNVSDALNSFTNRASMARFLGQIGMVPGDDDAGSIGEAERQAVSLGVREGLEIGLPANQFVAPDGAIENTQRQITGRVTRPSEFDEVKRAAGSQVGARASAVSRGPVVTDADVDRAMEESGLTASIAQRQADIDRMKAQRQATMAEAARLPGEMGEEEILQQAAGRMGEVGRYAGQPKNFIAVQRQLNDARRRFAEQEAKIAENETQRAAIESMSPSQRILLQASLDGLDMRQRHPRGIPPELTREALDFSTQIRNAMRNDPKIRGNDKAIVELAINLAQQNNPDGSVEEIRAMRDLILQGVAFEQTKRDDVAAHLPKQMAEAERLRQERIDNFEFGSIDLSEIEEEITADDIQFNRPALSSIEETKAPFAFTQQAFERMTEEEQKKAVRSVLENPELMFSKEGMITLNSMSGSQDLVNHLSKEELDRFKNIRGRVEGFVGSSQLQSPEPTLAMLLNEQAIDAIQFPPQAEAIEEVEEPKGLAALPLDPELEEQLLMQRAQ